MANKKHKEHHEEHIDETWLIPYADLLTLLLALFIVLYALVVQDIKKFEEQLIAFSAAFKDGLGIMTNKSNSPPIKEIPDIRAREENEKEENRSQEDSSEVIDKESKNKKQQEAQQQQQQIKEEQIKLEELKQKIDKYIEENNLKADLETKLDMDMLLITIRDNALFESGKAFIKPEAQKLATAMASLLANYQEYEIIVAGHTDNRPIRTAEFPSNWDLSAKRSLNFMTYLFTNEALKQDRFSSVGYGEFRPIADNNALEGRQKNRRVEIQIMRNFKGGSPEEVLTVTP
jgi:chemotaxis protein MotB